MGKAEAAYAKITVIIADDQALFAQGIRRLFEISAPDIEIVNTAANGCELIQMVDAQQPDVILMDVRMPEVDGVQATRIIHKRYPKIRIIVLTTFDDDQYVTNAVEYGAVGYLLKDIPPEELFEAVRMVRSSSFIASPKVVRKITTASIEDASDLTHFSDEQSESVLGPIPSELTERERDVLSLILSEFDNRDIADRLCLSERTVRNYVSSIYAKLDVQSRFELIRAFRPRR